MHESGPNSNDQPSAESLPTMSRLEYLLRVHWLGRLVSLALLSGLFYVPIALFLPPIEIHIQLGVSMILPSLLLSSWFGLGSGGLMGLRMSWRNLRLASIACVVSLLVLLLWMNLILATHEVAGDSSMYYFFAPRGTPMQEVFFLVFCSLITEFMFRGILLLVLAERFGAAAGIAISTCTAMLIQGWFVRETPIALLNYGLLGVILAVIVLRSHSLWFPIVFQFWWSVGVRIHSGVPLGGGHVRGGGLYDLEIVDSFAWLSWFTGEFRSGPASGLFISTLVILFALLFVPRLERLRDPVLAARDFRRRLRESGLAAVHGFRS